MCGISAIFGKNNSEFNNIYNLVKEQTHRGPDNNSIKKINSSYYKVALADGTMPSTKDFVISFSPIKSLDPYIEIYGE